MQVLNLPGSGKDIVESKYYNYIISQQGNVRFSERGDGIQVRYIPSILNFILGSVAKICIWGYEEPENSLEYNLALQMADNFKNYIYNNQIFLTTHSPA